MAKKKTGSGAAIWVLLIGVLVYAGIKICEKKPAKTPVNKTVVEKTKTDHQKYQLDFTSNFNSALASQDDLGLSILIAVDCSGSMADPPENSTDGKKKYRIASESLTEIITFLYDFYEKNVKNQDLKLKLGLLCFSDDVKVLYGLKDVNQANFNEIKALTSNPDNFTPNGKTAIGSVLAEGTEILAQAGTIFKSLILITDGENTAGTSPELVLEAIVNNRNNKTTEEMPVLTNNILVSFIGFDIDSSVFGDLEKIGSRLTSASDKEGLNASLKNLFLADITKLEAN